MYEARHFSFVIPVFLKSRDVGGALVPTCLQHSFADRL